MELTEKELINYYRYVYLYMNISVYKDYILNKINNEFITEIFTDIKFYNNPDFSNMNFLTVYRGLKEILKSYKQVERLFKQTS